MLLSSASGAFELASWVVLLQEFSIDRHHVSTPILIDQGVGSVWVDWFYCKWSFPLGIELASGFVSHDHGSPDSQDKVAFLEDSLTNLFVEGLGDSSLIELHMLLSLESLVVQSFKLLKTQYVLFFISHLCCQGDTQRWNLDFQWKYGFNSVYQGKRRNLCWSPYRCPVSPETFA